MEFPTEEELVTYYLTKKVNNESFPDPTNRFQDHRLHDFEPQQLSEVYGNQREIEMYIFNEKEVKIVNGHFRSQSIKTPNGNWRMTRKKAIEVGKRTVGFRVGFEYREGQRLFGTKTNWLMNEYSLNQAHSKWVLCKVYKSQKSTPSKRVMDVPSSPSKLKKHCSQAVIMAEPHGNDERNDSYQGQEEHRFDRTPDLPLNVVENDRPLQMGEQSYWDLLSPPTLQVSAVESNTLDGDSFEELIDRIDFTS